MPIKNFPFLKPNPADPRERPWLFVNIKNPHTGLVCPTFGLIDTGADECALPASFADLVGHNLTSGKAKQINTGNGVTTAYRHTCTIEILNTNQMFQGTEEIAYTIDETLIDFMPNLHCTLLGVETFLNKFILTIDYPHNVFSIRKP